MCGIVGYVGPREVVPTVLDALTRLEYRGYDSAGIAVLDARGIDVCKRVGKLSVLSDAVRRRPMTGQLGIGHCLSGDALIQLADGRAARIDSLIGEATVTALDLDTLKMVPRRARIWSHPAPEALLKLRIPFGTITCTPQHRLFTVDESGQLIPKRADELVKGDLLAHARVFHAAGRAIAFRPVTARRFYRLGDGARARLRLALSYEGVGRAATRAHVSPAAIYHLWELERNASEAVLRPLAASLDLPFPLSNTEPIHSHHGSFVEFPERSSAPLMQWLGYLWGDGHVGQRGVRFKDTDRDVLAAYQRLTRQRFNLAGRTAPVPHTRAYLLEVNSLGLADWLRSNVLSRRNDFLDEIATLPTDELAAFLRGLFDAEGCVARQAGQVNLTMTDVELVRRIQLWLLRVGVVASLTRAEAAPQQRRPKPSLSVLITRHDALAAFQHAIGFSSQRKQRWFDMVLRTKRKGFYVQSRALPMSKAALFQRFRALGLPSAALRPFAGGRRFTDDKAAVFLKHLASFPQASNEAEILQRHLQGDVRSQEILSIRRVQGSGRVYDLAVEEMENFFANGILSHNSRWATHGEPSEVNAHPHTDCTGQLALVHNGIIENYAALKTRLLRLGHRFRSKTDTEVIAHLVEEHAKRLPFEHAWRRALKELRGAYAICLISRQAPQTIFAAKTASPLVVGVGDGEQFLASDVPAILGYTKRVLYLNDGETATLTPDGIRLTRLDGRPAHRAPSLITWDLASAQKEGCTHFMLKEIKEQPAAVTRTFVDRLPTGARAARFDKRTQHFLDRQLAVNDKVVIIACGTAYHAGLVGEYLLEELARLPVTVDLASEFRYRGPMVDQHTTVIAITQSGETADTLASVRLAKERGAKVLSICNVMGSSIARASDAVIYTHAGPEIAVASTKAYTSQLTALTLLTLELARRRRRITQHRWRELMGGLQAIPTLMERALRLEPQITQLAKRYANRRNFYYLGRRYNYPSALEGALKLKEICPLIHAEGYAAGEMKHGPISLLRTGWPVVCIAPQSSIHEKMLSNIQEVRARHADVIAVATTGDREIAKHTQATLYIPTCEELFSPMLVAVPLQLFAYHVARANHCDIDQPPNLAKSVTVE